MEGLEIHFRDHFGVWRGPGAQQKNPEAPRRHPGAKNTDFKDGWLEKRVRGGVIVVLVSIIVLYLLMSMFAMRFGSVLMPKSLPNHDIRGCRMCLKHSRQCTDFSFQVFIQDGFPDPF